MSNAKTHHAATARQAFNGGEYWQDARGRLIPVELIRPIDQLRDDVVCSIVGSAIAMNAALKEFKAKVLAEATAFLALSAEQYNVKFGGAKGNVTLFSFDGRFKVQIQVSESIQFDERLQSAKALIDECINEWSQTSRPEIKVLVQDAFQTDKEGKISTARVLGLRRLGIEHDKWQLAMQAIGESLQVVGSKEYIRFYERIGDSDQYRAISIDLAAL